MEEEEDDEEFEQGNQRSGLPLSISTIRRRLRSQAEPGRPEQQEPATLVSYRTSSAAATSPVYEAHDYNIGDPGRAGPRGDFIEDSQDVYETDAFLIRRDNDLESGEEEHDDEEDYEPNVLEDAYMIRGTGVSQSNEEMEDDNEAYELRAVDDNAFLIRRTSDPESDEEAYSPDDDDWNDFGGAHVMNDVGAGRSDFETGFDMAYSGQGSSGQTGFTETMYGQPNYGQSAYEQPAYGEPSWQQQVPQSMTPVTSAFNDLSLASSAPHSQNRSMLPNMSQHYPSSGQGQDQQQLHNTDPNYYASVADVYDAVPGLTCPFGCQYALHSYYYDDD